MKANSIQQVVEELPKRSRYKVVRIDDITMQIILKNGKIHLQSPREYEIIDEANRLMGNRE